MVQIAVLTTKSRSISTLTLQLWCTWSLAFSIVVGVTHTLLIYSPLLCPSYVQVSSRTLAFALRRDYLPQMGIERRVAQGEEVHSPQAEQPRGPASYGGSCSIALRNVLTLEPTFYYLRYVYGSFQSISSPPARDS